MAAVTTLVLLLADTGDAGSDEGASHTVDVIKIVLGALLLFLAVRQWRSRPANGEQVPMPGWMQSIDSFTPVRALGIGVLLSALNPKNLLMAIGAGASIGQAGLNAGQAVVAVLVFVAIASVTIGGAVGYYLIGGKRAESTLDGWKAWLTENNAAVMAVLLLIFGLLLLGKGISGRSA